MSSNEPSSSAFRSQLQNRYPLPAQLEFVPGGVSYRRSQKVYITESKKSVLIERAKLADDRLRQICLQHQTDCAQFLPSLSVLCEAVFGRLTGCGSDKVKGWADALVLAYYSDSPEHIVDDVLDLKPAASSSQPHTTVASLLKAELQKTTEATPTTHRRPCGYVFKRDDIAWNCRNCQADPTCVICDDCFRNSNHEGHEVYFHRTSPGGCCDCGDTEAWQTTGCCDSHRPDEAISISNSNDDDPLECVKAAATARQWNVESLNQPQTKLPARFEAALGVVIGAAIECLLDSVNCAGIGADAVQWKRQWCDEAAKIANQSAHHEDLVFGENHPVSLEYFMNSNNLPENYELLLRLHNDDVHTFDEVIEALHESPHNRQENRSLVIEREEATKMTHHVDSDGQVTVKHYKTVGAAMRGFRRLKSKGLHCAVVSSAQVEAEQRARMLCSWLSEIASSHPVAQALLVHALVTPDDFEDLGGVYAWRKARMMAPWAAISHDDETVADSVRFNAFPPTMSSSYVTREEAELLHGIALGSLQNPAYTRFLEETGTVAEFYSRVPYRLPSGRYHKSPHALWGTLPSNYSDPYPLQNKHPLLERYLMNVPSSNAENRLSESIYVMDTDLRKQQEAELITSSVYTHKLPGLNMISGIGTIKLGELDARRPPLPSPMELRHLLATSSFRAPLSPILLLLLLDPYPTKQLRGTVHPLILSLLTNARFKSRFSAALAVAYRPLSTLFCAGVGTEADTPLHFTVQIFTAGSVARALCHGQATEKLLVSDHPGFVEKSKTPIGVFVPPIAHVIARCIHTNLLGATKEVNMILTNAAPSRDDSSQDDNVQHVSLSLLPALTYVAGEHPLMTPLPAAPDDEFLDSRSTRHKRLPHLLRDLDYVIETPGTALRLLLPGKFPVYQGPSLSLRGEDILAFPAIFARMLRLAQGMDPQKRKISGGHVEFEHNRWLEAFGLSLTLGGTRDALAESACIALAMAPNDGSHLIAIREAVGNVAAALLREIKLWLYREGMMETGLPIPPGGAHAAMDMDQLAKVETLQRSTLHVSSSQFSLEDPMSMVSSDFMQGASSSVALSCATGVKMTESQLTLIENALKVEAAQLNDQPMLGTHTLAAGRSPSTVGPEMSDWLRVPHSPLAGDALSFHLPLHRALAKCIKSICSVVVLDTIVAANPYSWWKIPVLDDMIPDSTGMMHHPLVPLIRTTLRSSNCRVVWSSGPDCTPQEAQRRRSRSRTVSANIAVAKVLHSLADHPIRCLAAAQQIERHLWARNGTSVAGMAMNYSSAPLCRSFRDLDLLLVQLSAAGMTCGLGARRIFSLLLNRFSMDGYLCDPERKGQGGTVSPSGSQTVWVNPPRLQDPDHAIVLAEAFFSTMCVLITELPPPPQTTPDDDACLRRSIRRELLHALAAEPRTHSEAMTAASCGISRREESEGSSGSGGSGGLFRQAFASVLGEIGRRKNQSSTRASSGPPAYELRAEHSDEYDPTFFHLRRQEHQHAMDVVARLRKQKWGADKEKLETHCLPVVCAPPLAHPRFLPCRLLLHLDSMDASIRRALLFAVTNGLWLPPSAPKQRSDSDIPSNMTMESDTAPVTTSISSVAGEAEIPITIFNRRHLHSRSLSGTFPRRGSAANEPFTFSSEVVASSSVSFLEVLQLLTLQAHTLEECASLHRLFPDLDAEARALSSGLSINTYLSRLVKVPDSLIDVWALMPYPDGPLKSKGSGAKRGSILGLLIALYEHREDHVPILDSKGDYGQSEEDHGGARHLASSGLKWLLRFVNALVAGAPSVGEAMKSATTGVQIQRGSGYHVNTGTIDEEVRSSISGMLANLPALWPKARAMNPSGDKSSDKGKEAGKAAQQRALETMKKRQNQFLRTIAPDDIPSAGNDEEETETDLCIICRCDDSDGETNGPLGYLGHVQRSRMIQMRSTREWASHDEGKQSLVNMYRVVGHMGCQLRETEEMDSNALTCLPKGSVVAVLKKKVSAQHDILSRRVFVRHETKDHNTGEVSVSEGWASMQSSQGYVILSPLVSMCFSNTRWGGTRPVIQQCGHGAHLKCVETHTLSLHHRAAGDQPYDGRFAANISDGEFLCPLCKQLSNILIPRDRPSVSARPSAMDVDVSAKGLKPEDANLSIRRKLSCTSSYVQNKSPLGIRALEDFGSQLYNAMVVPWDRSVGPHKKKQDKWHRAIQKWDYEEEDALEKTDGADPQIGRIMRLLRQQLISWSAVGHSAASLEAGARGVEEVLPFGVLSETSEPWPEYGKDCVDSHPMLLHLKRMLSGSSGLLELLVTAMSRCLANRNPSADDSTVIGACLSNILEGYSWISRTQQGSEEELAWRALTALVASTPSHVARDGTISQRSEARATAAAFWVIRGNGSDSSKEIDPPTPLAVRQFDSQSHNRPSFPAGWGSMQPFSSENCATKPFRPGVACGFLYTPLLAWDFYALSGAVFSSIISGDDKDLPTAEELLHLAHTLLLGRIIQAVVTPYGIEVPDETDLDEFDSWSQAELAAEGEAIVKLVAHCRTMLSSKFMAASHGLVGDPNITNTSGVLAGVGTAILPFTRALVLMLRACTAIVRERQPNKFSGELFVALCKSDLMTHEDGFLIAKALRCPTPSAIVNDVNGYWMGTINRWLVAVTELEMHHMSENIGSGVNSNEAKESSGEQGVITMSQDRGHVLSDDSTDEMAIDLDETAGNNARLIASGFNLSDVEDSDEELDDGLDEAEEMVTLDMALGGAFEANASAAGGNTDSGDTSDHSSSAMEDIGASSDSKFANVSRSPILPFQPSVLGIEGVGPGRRGSTFDFVTANRVMSDLSHLGMGHWRESPTFTLIRLPKSFVELYNIVNRINGRDDANAMEESDDVGSAEAAICLLTGAVMRSGSTRRVFSRSTRPPGACTLHARKTASGIGIFFLVQKCTVLLVHNNKSAYSPSLYVDQHGEEDPQLRRGRPLFLNEARFRALELMWRQQGIPREVAQIRSTSDRVIRDNWY